jgi:hypothetical protein
MKHLALLWLFAASLAPAEADTTPTDSARQEELSLQSYGAANPACLEWTDACATCLRADGVAHCSTPGIACQPAEIVCKAPAK